MNPSANPFAVSGHDLGGTSEHTAENPIIESPSADTFVPTPVAAPMPIAPQSVLAEQPPSSEQQAPAEQPKLDPLNTPLPRSSDDEALKKSQYFNNSIFWIELEKIVPNPYQPRKDFDQHALKDLADSIRMYGLLQPLVVTRVEIIKEDGGLATRYELISGERRWRASKLAGLSQAPVIIRAQEEDARVKLELAIIENLQREDLNAIDRARSFQRLAEEFGLKHQQIAEKMGKSREYVTNSIRLLALPEHMLQALSEKRISEGHTRPLLMLVDRPQEQEVLFKEITSRKMTVREAERAARSVAVERVRKQDPFPEYKELEKQFNEALGTRVFIEKKEQGGKLVIDFFNIDDVRALLEKLGNDHLYGANSAHAHSTAQIHPSISAQSGADQMASTIAADSIAEQMNALTEATGLETVSSASAAQDIEAGVAVAEAALPVDDSTPADKTEDEDLYSVKGFTI